MSEGRAIAIGERFLEGFESKGGVWTEEQLTTKCRCGRIFGNHRSTFPHPIVLRDHLSGPASASKECDAFYPEGAEHIYPRRPTAEEMYEALQWT